ncbi:hypothetical protein FNH05_28695 [Amycolatopsis rhizosphaerae]|uniref:Uncharacterized protein n=1 Tax=Amycolatopsis rhizosphaerae TaxID=2053003 RepID=A0A558B392_9PSEU|nr:hypothetical protein [Amycolatopsis rhizosphaerae]TVT30982.1 hypothetical protein FNH05_28695 [Amycolatopsis rhizosphaerae]
MHGEIRRSRLINMAVAIVMMVFGSGVSAVYDVGGLPPLVVSLPLTAVLLEVIRRSGLRPRITWDDHGTVEPGLLRPGARQPDRDRA